MGGAAIKKAPIVEQPAVPSQVKSDGSDPAPGPTPASPASPSDYSQSMQSSIHSMPMNELATSLRAFDKSASKRFNERTLTHRLLNNRLAGEPETIRRPPLHTLDELIESDEARAKISFIFEKQSPGESSRWEKILSAMNTNLEPSEEDPDPIQINIKMPILKKAIQKIFINKPSDHSSSDMTLVKGILYPLYKKHSSDRAQRISTNERDEKKLIEPHYVYGEMPYEQFSLILQRILSTYGLHRTGLFCDLGCGVGQLCYSACVIGTFQKCIGIDILGSLVMRGEKRVSLWGNMIGEEFIPSKIKDCVFEWIKDDFMETTTWTSATFLFLHWTAFSLSRRKTLITLLDRCAEGTFLVTLTHPIKKSKFELLVSDTCTVSWGKTTFFVYEKMNIQSS
mmetsp:Transcript_35553/g.36233  ORF Transcript_35553/g.36233 Transcript_35553/m.36233 type:complete len:396 (-) Transcript_35553:122-1309(-)|eukprot:CAMPEP_0182419256 /NCGR_PEP_ID=MMETSP1167-20130531/3694_1 /TAXON_ID=2988 /ORGANISM="Mallomonas Sp, Strain CCMP3275" /LENGTH=395 /DNA_ID=CAMNT_0024594023 /DNA_START=74 /DNA_END=1261 /DNA_ORIENTATION=-